MVVLLACQSTIVRSFGLGLGTLVFLSACGAAKAISPARVAQKPPPPEAPALEVAAPVPSMTLRYEGDGVADHIEALGGPDALLPPQPRGVGFDREASRISHLPPRPNTDEAIAIDLDTIPLAEDLAVGTQAASFSFLPHDLTPRCPPSLYAEPRVTWSLDLRAPTPFVIRLGSFILPPSQFLNGQYGDRALSPMLKLQNKQQATWSSLGSPRTSDGVDVTEFDGTFDPETGRVRASSKSRVTASAIVEGVLYAYRRCLGHCNEPVGSERRVEELSIVGPPAIWTGATAFPEEQSFDRRTSFTRVSAPIYSGASATLELIAVDDDIAGFKQGSAPLGPSSLARATERTTFSLDVVWPEASPRPSVTLFVGHQAGNVQSVESDGTQLFDEPYIQTSVCRRSFDLVEF